MYLKKIIAVIILTSLFPVLFYNVGIGLNLFIFNLLIFVGLKLTNRLVFKDVVNIIVLSGTLLSSIFVVVTGSDLAIAINILSLFLLAGIVLYPKSRNLFYTSFLSIINFFYAQYSFFSELNELSKGSKVAHKTIKILRIVIIPIIIVIIFILIYRAANPIFEGMLKSVFDAIETFFDWLFKNIEIAIVGTIVFGFILSNYFFLGKANPDIQKVEEGSSFFLKSGESKLAEKASANLKLEYSSAIILFVLLNVLILVINSIDIWWVWFNFSWDGEYLKQFVHEGTYLLILSILISLALSIYYFRGSVNFLKNNLLLRRLAYLWLFQNAILTFSVGIRNFWYINYFSLAYLRIGVIFFLILTLFSIYTVLIKIRDKKSTYFLFSNNAVAVYVLLVVMAFFNWDIIIAKYNFNHSETAFVHYDFMSRLSDNALPYLDKSEDELQTIDANQSHEFEFRDQYMNSSYYYDVIQKRKHEFLLSWPEIPWQEWNLAGARSYQKLNGK